jgi:hypothetical protein
MMGRVGKGKRGKRGRYKSWDEKQEKWRYHRVSTSHLILPLLSIASRTTIRFAHMRLCMPPCSLSGPHWTTQHRMRTTHNLLPFAAQHKHPKPTLLGYAMTSTSTMNMHSRSLSPMLLSHWTMDWEEQ